MDFNEWILNKVENLHTLFPFISVRVEINEISGFCFVEISPEEEFRNNEALIKAINDIYIEQLEFYPPESLSFISTDSNYKIKNPIFSLPALPQYI